MKLKRHLKKGTCLWILCMSMLLCTGCTKLNLSNTDLSNLDISKVEQIFSDTEETESVTQEDSTQTVVESISNGKYAYECLDAETKVVYDEVLNTILKQQENVTVSTLDTNVLDAAYRAVNADYGGLFWVSGYVYTQYTKNDELTSLEFTPKYTMSYEERTATQEQIDGVVNEMLAGVAMTDSDYTKVKYVYETLINNVDYVLGAENNQNIISVFLGKQTVCQGYACATQYLLNLLDVPSVIITGNTNGDTHAWNLVLLDGAYYYVDTTWGNSTYTDSDSQVSKFVNYDYLNITTTELTRTHTIEMNLPLPECTATADNYYVAEGLYYTDWYPDEIGALYRQAWEAGKADVAVKFADAALYNEAKQYFITDQHLGDYCSGLRSFYYLENTEQNILTVNFK